MPGRCHCDGVRRFVDDDCGYLDWLAANPQGFVINAARNTTAAYLVLHRASCYTIGGRPARGSQWTADYIKFCGGRAELEAFASAHLAGNAHPHGICLHGLTSDHQPSADSPSQAGAPPGTLGPLWASGLTFQPTAAPFYPRGLTVVLADPPVMSARPSGQPLQLTTAPRLASWNEAGDPDQVRLEAFLAGAERLLRSQYEPLSDGLLALRLDVGLPQTTALLGQRDLDNYLFPLAATIDK